MAYTLDSTTVDLCLSVFPWATFRKAKAAIKLHTLLSLRGNYPSVVIITPASVHDVNILDRLIFEAGSFYVFDRKARPRAGRAGGAGAAHRDGGAAGDGGGRGRAGA